jgi:hypothetical protein
MGFFSVAGAESCAVCVAVCMNTDAALDAGVVLSAGHAALCAAQSFDNTDFSQSVQNFRTIDRDVTVYQKYVHDKIDVNVRLGNMAGASCAGSWVPLS